MRQTPRLPFSFRNEVVIIFDWLGDIFSGIGSAIGDAMDFLGTQISNAIWDAMLKWFYEIIYGAIADFFEMIQNTRRSFAQKHSAAFLLKRRLTMKEIKRGEIYSADFGAGFGSEQSGVRPILILQNNTGNKHSPTTIVAAITGRKTKAALPTHVAITASGLKTESTVLLEQIRTIDKARLGEYIGKLDSKTLAAVDRAIVVSLGIKYLEGLLNG